MAKFTDYTQKTKPADADLLLIHDNAGAANKKTPFSGVWSWILDKLASAVISQLETTNKSIIPAINELNSKKAESVNGYTDASGRSIFDVIKPTSTNNGIYTYTNIDDIPESSNPKNNFVRVIKMREAMILQTGANTIYLAVGSSGQWIKTWYKFSGAKVS